MAPNDPTAPINPATEPTTPDGKISAESVCRIVDQNWCPQRAMLKSAIANPRGDFAMSREAGIMAALRPRQIFLERLSVTLRSMSRLLSQPPTKLPAPPRAKGIQ